MKKLILVNTARGKIVNRDALVEALASEHLQGYAGDVWIDNLHLLIIHGEQCLEMLMTVHYSGMTLEAQKRIRQYGVKHFRAFLQFMNLSKIKILLLQVVVLLVKVIQLNRIRMLG